MLLVLKAVYPALAYFPRAQAQVSSALEGLTSEFGMESGVALPLKAPGILLLRMVKNDKRGSRFKNYSHVPHL